MTDRMSLSLAQADPAVAAALDQETLRQHEGLEMIASENFVSEAVLEAAGSIFTNKYAEGYPGRRYYGGCEFTDVVENLARDRAKQIFGGEHVNVQPHSGSQANAAAYAAVLQPGDTILGLDLAHGGHLTHGHRLSFSGKLYRPTFYQVRRDTETIDYDEMEAVAIQEKPKVIIGGASAYPPLWEFARMRQIADQVGAPLARVSATYFRIYQPYVCTTSCFLVMGLSISLFSSPTPGSVPRARLISSSGPESLCPNWKMTTPSPGS